ncbi:MAG: WecB/TagA/CpsF family glycosyltransferase [Gammaproteobacteria bacterium]
MNSPQHDDERDRQLEKVYERYSPSGLRRRRWQALKWTLVTTVVQLLSSLKRLLDLAVALIILVITAPLFVFWVALRGGSDGAFFRSPRIGRWGTRFNRLSFSAPPGSIFRFLGIHHLPVLVNILRGEMSLVGPRAAAPDEYSLRDRQARRRYGVRPGLIGPWWIRGRANIDYGTELEADAEYIEQQSLGNDMGLALRAIPALLYGKGVPNASDQVSILGIPVENLTMDEAVEAILEAMEKPVARQICFVNADCFNIAARDPEYRQTLLSCDAVYADGIGVKLAGKILRREVKQNVNGTDLFPRLCDAMQGTQRSLYLLGARPGIADAVAEFVTKNYPDCRIAGHHHGYLDEAGEREVIEEIRASGAELLLVAFGAPRQDRWIEQHLEETGVRVAMGVGGLFDFYSGRMPRAPQWMRELALEWLYRFIQEPRRMWRRYFVGNFVFLFRIYRERFFGPPQ